MGTRQNSSLVQPEHLAALWQLSLKESAPQAPCWHLNLGDGNDSPEDGPIQSEVDFGSKNASLASMIFESHRFSSFNYYL
jgi:hypothetical protein